ncbi:MAG: AMP-binding protein [Acidimicrobiia bacterium]
MRGKTPVRGRGLRGSRRVLPTTFTGLPARPKAHARGRRFLLSARGPPAPGRPGCSVAARSCSYDPAVNLVEVLLGGGASDAPALVGARGVTSYATVTEQVERLGGELVRRGVEPGDRVVVMSGNDEMFVASYLAVLQVGAIAVPLNPMAPPAELERELSVLEAKLALASGPGVSMLGAAAKGVVRVDLDALPDERAPRVERADTDTAVLLFTSGTAGAPKAAMLTHGNLAANIRQVLDHPGLRVSSSDVALGALPFFHVFGLNVVLGVSLAAGGAVALVAHFEPAATAAVVRAQGVTVLAGVPTMFAAWVGADLAPDTFSSVRLAVSGAAELPSDVAHAFRDRFHVELHQGYGLTEASPIVTTTALMGGAPPPGSIGPPIPGVEVRLVDADGADALAGDPGELWVHGPNVFPGYWHDTEATDRVLTNGWLRTGDVAVVDDDGGLRLVDRAKDLIIVSGFNVFPVEVEDVLRAHPDVADAAVVGEPSPRTGEAVVAYVQAAPGHDLDPDALSTHCAHALARYKCPTRFEIVDELPRAVSGKLLRRELRD